MFGWDWGAHLPDAGIFRPVTLLGIDRGRIDNVLILQQHEKSAGSRQRKHKPLGNPTARRGGGRKKGEGRRRGFGGVGSRWVEGEGGVGGRGAGEGGGAITAPDGTKAVYEDSPTEIVIEEPKLCGLTAMAHRIFILSRWFCIRTAGK